MFLISRTAIAGAIIGPHGFYNSKNLNYIRPLSFYDSKRSIGDEFFESVFFGVYLKQDAKVKTAREINV